VIFFCFSFISLFFLSSLLFASDTWNTSALRNTNSTDVTTNTIDVKDILAKRKETVEQFKTEFDLSDDEAKKVVHRLKKEFLKDKNALYDVDIFIADTIPGMDVKSIKFPSYSVSINYKDKNPQIVYKQNKKILTSNEIEAILEAEKQASKERQELYKQAKQQNLDTIIKTISKDITPEIEAKLYEAVAKSAPYVTLQLTSKTIEKLLKKAEKSLLAVDVHLSFEPSGVNELSCDGTTGEKADWCNRLGDYLDITGVNAKQENDGPLYYWNGKSVGIYYSDVECPSIADVTDPNGVFDGYLPVLSDRYNILYLDDDPANNGNIIDLLDENSTYYNYAQEVYNAKTHTKLITGILSTVSPAAALFCKGAELVDYNNSTSTVYEQVLPTVNEMSSIMVESYSLNKEASANSSDLTRAYYPMDMIFDKHAYDFKVPIFISAGNLGKYIGTYYENAVHPDVVSPAKAFNVITVGNYGLDDYGQPIINTTSSFENPLIDGNLSKSYQKPEISAPGTSFYVRDHNGTDIVDNFRYSGTSFATPFAAAATADLISGISYIFNQKYGAMRKAEIIALARDHVQVGGTTSRANIRDHVGEGGIDLNTSLNYSDHIAHVDINTFSTFYNGKLCTIFSPSSFKGSLKVRFVIAWFSRISDANINDNPNRFSMEVLDPNNNVVGFYKPDGTYATIANEPYQGYQVIDFTLQDVDPGLYKARVCKIHEDTINPASLGFSSSYIPFEYIPPHPPEAGVMEAITTYLLFD